MHQQIIREAAAMTRNHLVDYAGDEINEVGKSIACGSIARLVWSQNLKLARAAAKRSLSIDPMVCVIDSVGQQLHVSSLAFAVSLTIVLERSTFRLYAVRSH